jgi:hypothetical protein
VHKTIIHDPSPVHPRWIKESSMVHSRVRNRYISSSMVHSGYAIGTIIHGSSMAQNNFYHLGASSMVGGRPDRTGCTRRNGNGTARGSENLEARKQVRLTEPVFSEAREPRAVDRAVWSVSVRCAMTLVPGGGGSSRRRLRRLAVVVVPRASVSWLWCLSSRLLLPYPRTQS